MQAPVTLLYEVVETVVAVISQPVCVEHELVVLVKTVGLIDPPDETVDVMFRLQICVYISTEQYVTTGRRILANAVIFQSSSATRYEH